MRMMGYIQRYLHGPLLSMGILALFLSLALSVGLYDPLGPNRHNVKIFTFDGEESASQHGLSRYVHRIVEDFDNRSYVDVRNTSCLVDTFSGRAILSGDTHNTMKFNYDFRSSGGCGDYSTWYTYNFGRMTWAEAEEMANNHGAQFAGAPSLYNYNAPYKNYERWVGEKDANNAYTSSSSWNRVNTRSKTDQHYCVLAYANEDSPGYDQFGDSRVVNGKLYFYHDYGTISERTCYNYCRQHGARPLNPYLFGINTRAHMVENHNCHGSVQYNGAGTASDGGSNHNYRGFIGYHVSATAKYLGHFQSSALYRKLPTIGAARLTWFDHRPPGTDIVYNMTADGDNWVTMENGTTHVFEHRGSRLMWNATFTTPNEDIVPYIDKVIIEYDLFSDPEPSEPDSTRWHGTSTPLLKWNFTDPDRGDHQSDFQVEIYNTTNMTHMVYDSDWVNSTDPKYKVKEDLPDGTYYWRVRTKDVYHAASNWSVLKMLKLDVTKPEGHITIVEDRPSGAFPGIGAVNDQLADLEIFAFDNGSGVADMQIINDRGTPGPWEEFSSVKRIVIESTDGLKTIGVRFRDNAGIVSRVFNDTIYFDLKGPYDVMVSSVTHPDTGRYFNSTDPVFGWDPPYEVTEIKGYSYMVDSSQYTEPGKVLYNPNGDISGTIPGDFSGLDDGTWYFHIVPCDVYDQWGNTSHFRFNIDTTPPSIYDLTPNPKAWYNNTRIRAGAVFSDKDGFGLDLGTIQYSIRMDGGTFSAWKSDGVESKIVQTGLGDNPEKAEAWVDVDVSEGGGNAIRWRISDIPGNGPVGSNILDIKIDTTMVTFEEPYPEPYEVFLEPEVSCGITIVDTGGSGVDGKSVEYCISRWGDDDGSFLNWSKVDMNMVRETLNVMVEVPFGTGTNNYIRWRAKDGVGNGYAYSDPSRVWVNSRPEPLIRLPIIGGVMTAGDSFELNASGTTDPDGDELSLYWELKNKTTKRVEKRAWGQYSEVVLVTPGTYTVELYANDGYGFNESKKVTIEVVPGGSDQTDIEGDGEPVKKGARGFLAEWWWTLALAAFVIIIIILLFIVMARRKRKREEESLAPMPIHSPERPYPVGSKNFHMPQYSAMGTYPPGPPPRQGPQVPRQTLGGQTAPGTPPPGRRMIHSGSQTLPPGGSPTPALPQYAGMGTPLEPIMQSQVYEGGAPVAGQILPVPTIQAPLTSAYSLPNFATEAGLQNLDLMALPPGPETLLPTADQPVAEAQQQVQPMQSTTFPQSGDPMPYPAISTDQQVPTGPGSTFPAVGETANIAPAGQSFDAGPDPQEASVAPYPPGIEVVPQAPPGTAAGMPREAASVAETPLPPIPQPGIVTGGEDLSEIFGNMAPRPPAGASPPPPL